MRYFALLLCCIFFAATPALAQTLPPIAACGLPAEGTIWQSVTYTLSGDCTQSGTITIASAGTEQSPNSVTINGGGHRISGGAFKLFFGTDAILNLNDLTIDGDNAITDTVISVGTVNASRVSIVRTRGSALIATQSSLNSVLFSTIQSEAFSLGGNGTAMFNNANTDHTLTNVVIRNSLSGGGAIVLRSGANLTTNGCLTFSGNVPYDVYTYAGGTWTDNSTGPCSGTIGNGDQAVLPAPELLACGFPAPGNLDASATYTLRDDCDLSGAYYISEDVNIRVIGNGRALSTTRTGNTLYTAATGSLQLENIALKSIRLLNWGDFRADRIVVSDNVNSMFTNVGEARFTQALFTGNSATRSTSRSVGLAYGAYQNGYTSFTDSTFRGNTGGLGVLAAFGATIDLSGCITFEDNSPADTYIYAGQGGAVNDNRDADCDTPITDPLQPPVKCSPHCDMPPPPVKSSPHRDFAPQEDECSLKLGAIGLICRERGQPPLATVWRIRPNPEGEHLPSVGIFMLAVEQPQVEAVPEGLVACSADGRVAVRTGLSDELRQVFESSPQYDDELLVPRRYIVFSKGPTFDEGKVHNVVLDNALDGRVFGIVDTYGGPPAPECITAPPAQAPPQPTSAPVYVAPVQAQAPQPDGSIIHVVREGDTISAIAVAYRVYQLDIITANQLEHMGRWIYPGQELLIRAADA